MTQKIVLALALTLATMSLTAPTALACGGSYAAPFPFEREHPEASAVREAIERRVNRVFREPPTNIHVYGVEVEGDRASARVQLRGSSAERTVRLHRRHGAWRVVAFG